IDCGERSASRCDWPGCLAGQMLCRWSRSAALLAHDLGNKRDTLVADCDRGRRAADHGLHVGVDLAAERAPKGIAVHRRPHRFGFGSALESVVGHERDASRASPGSGPVLRGLCDAGDLSAGRRQGPLGSVRWSIPSEHACYAYASGSVAGAVNDAWSSSFSTLTPRSPAGFRNPARAALALAGLATAGVCRAVTTPGSARAAGSPRFVTEQVRALDHLAPRWWRRGGLGPGPGAWPCIRVDAG